MTSILFLTTHLPYPPASGGRRREYELIRRVSRHYNVYLSVMSICYDRDIIHAPYMRQFCESVDIFKLDHPNVAYKELHMDYPVQILNHTSIKGIDHIRRLIQAGKIDIIHIERFYLMQHLLGVQHPPIFLVDQNIEYNIMRQKYEISLPEEKEYNERQYKLTMKFEIDMWRLCSLCGALTNDDYLEMMRFVPRTKIAVTPLGVDHSSSLLQDESITSGEHILPSRNSAPSLLFIGNFDYEPTQDAANYLVKEIFLKVRAKLPRLQLFLVGQDLGANLAPFKHMAGVHVTGTVESLKPYFEVADIFVCPLRMGGGLKVKMIEALQHQKPIVSTSIGAQGIPIVADSPIIIADHSDDFCRQLIYLLEDPTSARRLGAQAQNVLKFMPSWDDAASKVEDCYIQLLGPSLSLEAS